VVPLGPERLTIAASSLVRDSLLLVGQPPYSQEQEKGPEKEGADPAPRS
jgi:hypothetical protein